MPFLKQQSIVEIFSTNPNRYSPLIQLTQNIMQGESPFTLGERELIAAYVSGLNACHFCYNAHQAIATSLNVDPNLLDALINDIKTAPIEERFYPVFVFVSKLTLTPSKITPTDIDDILAAGWDEQAVEDAIAVCFLFNLMNRLVHGFGLESPDQQQLSDMANMINTQGYQTLIQSVNET
ncbi:MAG: carboxymuconolactone decarboxylase family protein [Microcystaceae cyanobacterium]